MKPHKYLQLQCVQTFCPSPPNVPSSALFPDSFFTYLLFSAAMPANAPMLPFPRISNTATSDAVALANQVAQFNRRQGVHAVRMQRFAHVNATRLDPEHSRELCAYQLANHVGSLVDAFHGGETALHVGGRVGDVLGTAEARGFQGRAYLPQVSKEGHRHPG